MDNNLKGAPPASVAIRRCTDYRTIRPTLRDVMDATGLTQTLAHRRVFLKPNLMKGSLPEHRNNTHPAFVGSLTAELVALGCEVVVGDSSGILGFTDEVFDASGVRSAVERAGGRVVNLDAGPFERISLAGREPAVFWLPRVLFEVDAVVSVPKLKTHSLNVLSLALKNLVGTMPGATKCAMHLRRPGPDAFAEGVVDLYRALVQGGVRSLTAMVDGVWALAGRGPGVGPIPRVPGLVVGGDPFAVDVACALAVGFDPASIPTIRASAGRGLGPDPRAPGEEMLRIVREAVPEPGPFERPTRNWSERTIWTTLAHYWVRGRIVKPVHDPGRCEGGRRCVDVCPVRCVRKGTRGWVIGRECIGCLACHEVCPTGAMGLTVPRPLRGLFRRRAAGLDVGKLR